MKYDIVIIGGGPAGLSFARSLGDSKFNVLVVERATADDLKSPLIDGRDIALTHLSKKILTEMGVLARIPASDVSPIKQAKVINGNSSYCLEIDSKKADVDALGYLVPNYLIRKALYEVVAQLNNVQIQTETTVSNVEIGEQQATVYLSNGEVVNATLVVAADSRFSESRRKWASPPQCKILGVLRLSAA